MSILFLSISFVLSGQTRYIDKAGSDATGDGSISKPWKTLYKACNEVVTKGDTIHVNAGIYVETAICMLSPGVSIVGEGIDVTVLSSTLTSIGGYGNYNSIIRAYSDNVGSEGNHVFKGLTFDGADEIVPTGVFIRKRDNIEFVDCKFMDFYTNGIDINGTQNYYTEPDIYITGFKVHDCIFYNSSGYYGSPANAYGALDMGGTKGTEIYENTFIQPAYYDRRRGILIKGVKAEHAGLKIYNNTIHKYCRDESAGVSDLPFAIELWDVRGGCEIYNNNVKGAIDLVNVWEGDYGFGAKVYDNIIGDDSLVQVYYPAIMLESNQNNVEVYRNYCTHTGTAISFASQNGWNPDYPHTYKPFTKRNIKVYHNVFWNMGTTTPDDPYDNYLRALSFSCTQSEHVYESIMIYNNIVTNDPEYNTLHNGVWLPEAGTSTNFFIKNNIFMNFKYGVIRANGGGLNQSMNNLKIDNNVIYNNGTNSYTWYADYATRLTNFSFANNITADPLWVNEGVDFRLQETSPAINSGVNVGLNYDFNLNPIIGLPDINVYEYGYDSGHVSSGGEFIKNNDMYNIKLYPNPTQNFLTIDASDYADMTDYTIMIFNLVGLKVYETNVSQQLCEISLSDWAGIGIYILHVYDQANTLKAVKKLIIN